MISIVLPLYNKEKQIKKTLESVLAQTFQDFEIVIVNDGSKDNSVRIVEEFQCDKIRIIHQTNQGVSVARNTGIAHALYDYVAFLDGDDEWCSDYLETQVSLIRNYPECSVFGCGYTYRNKDGKTQSILLNKMPFQTNTGVLTNYFEVAACSSPPLWTSIVVATKQALLSVGGFPSGVVSGEDLLTWAKLALKYQIAYNIESHAFFNQSMQDGYEPDVIRKPEKCDEVGGQLKYLLKTNRKTKGLVKYIAFWHKMRAALYLMLGDNYHAFQESYKSLCYNPANIKVWVYLALILLPSSLRLRVFHRFGHVGASKFS